MYLLFLTLFIVAYLWWFFCEQVALTSRAAGLMTNSYALGKVLHDQLLTLSRYGYFLLGPLLGGGIFFGARVEELLLTACVGFLLTFLLGWQYKRFVGLIISYFSSALNAVKSEKYSFVIFFKYLFKSQGVILCQNLVDKYKYGVPFKYSFTINIFASASVLIINILAIYMAEFSVVILQMAPLISGIGTFLYQFYLNPIIANHEHLQAEGGVYVEVLSGRFYAQFVAFFLSLVIYLIYLT